MDVRAAIHEVALEHRGRYGYRRVSRELRRRGLVVNHKRVARLMREDNLLAIQPRARVRTTDSDHELNVYLNLAARVRLSGINQLRVADITYVRLRAEFVYLAVVLDAFSRKVVGWALGRSLAAQLAASALERAVARPGASLRPRQPACLPGVCGPAPKPRHAAQHEPARQPLRQRQLRELRAHSQAGRDRRQYLPRSGRPSRPHRGVHRALLQSHPASLGAGLPAAGGVRASRVGAGEWLRRSKHEFFQAWGNLSMGSETSTGAWGAESLQLPGPSDR